MTNPLVTTDDTPTTMVTYTPLNGRDDFAVWDFSLTATDGSNCAAWVIRAVAKSISGVASLVGSVLTISEQKDDAAELWMVDVDTSGGSVQLLVTGDPGTTITWVLQGTRQIMSGTGSGPRWVEA